MHILSPETDNCPSWISGRERMTVENISWSISTKECCRPRRGLNPRPPGLQSDGASNWAPEAGTSLACLCLWESDTSTYGRRALSPALWSRFRTVYSDTPIPVSAEQLRERLSRTGIKESVQTVRNRLHSELRNCWTWPVWRRKSYGTT